MLPAMYVLGKQLTKRTDMAFAAMTMMALDCMHLTREAHAVLAQALAKLVPELL